MCSHVTKAWRLFNMISHCIPEFLTQRLRFPVPLTFYNGLEQVAVVICGLKEEDQLTAL